MKLKKLLFTALMLFFVAFAGAQVTYPYISPDDEDYTESCTSIMVGKNASTDGSV